MAIFVTDTTSVTETVELEVTPEEQDRDWRRRWLETQRELRDLLEPRTGPIDGEAIHAARHDLHTFFVNAYHIKDSLKLASATTGVSEKRIETALSNNPDLALLADLANLDKHGRLSNAPRSGCVPSVTSTSGVSGDDSAGWRLRLRIDHCGTGLDGLDVASRVVDAWRNELQGWGLL